MKFTGEVATNLLLMTAVTMIALALYEIVMLFDSVLVLGEWG